MDPDEPVFCDLVIEQQDSISGGGSFFDNDSAVGGTVGLAILAGFFVCGVCFHHFYCRRANEMSKLAGMM